MMHHLFNRGIALAMGGFVAACTTPGTGGDAPQARRGMRLPPRGRTPAPTRSVEPMASDSMTPARPAPKRPALSPEEALRAKLRANPKDHASRRRLAELLLGSGAIANAEVELMELLRVPAEAQRARVLLCRLTRAVTRLDDAKRWGRLAVASDAKDVDARLHLGLTLLALRERSAATAQLELAVKLAPQRAELRRVLGEAYLRHHKHRLAVAQLKEAARLAPRDPWPLTLLGDTYWAMSLLKLADATYRRAATLEGGPPVFRAVALDKLGTLLAHRGLRDKARAVLDACRKSFPHLGCPYTYAALLPANPVKVPGTKPPRRY
ncbi:MAG: hypothetical protein ABI333_17365 [bacterium]